MITLVEAGVTALQGLFDHRAPDLVLFTAFLEQVLDRLEHQVQCLLFLVLVAYPDLPIVFRLFENCIDIVLGGEHAVGLVVDDIEAAIAAEDAYNREILRLLGEKLTEVSPRDAAQDSRPARAQEMDEAA